MNLDEQPKINPFPKESDFMREFLQPKQEMNVPEIPVFQTEQEEAAADDVPGTLTGKEKYTRKDLLRMSKTLIAVASAPISVAASAVARSADNERYYPTGDETESLEHSLADYLETVGANIPPSIVLIITVVMVYGSVFARAFKDRRDTQRAEAHEKKVKELQDKIEQLKTERRNGTDG